MLLCEIFHKTDFSKPFTWKPGFNDFIVNFEQTVCRVTICKVCITDFFLLARTDGCYLSIQSYCLLRLRTTEMNNCTT